ncbi:MAG: peptide deformylase [Bacteroidetes bacterium]|nr:MAG: peptide deformylase [Bacteroidota bacterium]
MIYPIRAYGDAVLRAECEEITEFNDELKKLVDDMFETMDASDGVGLAAPQIGKKMRLFTIDSTLFDKGKDKDKKDEGLRQIFINPVILEETGEEWAFEEGCLSIPDIREDVLRQPNVRLKYQTADGKEKEEEFDGMTARVIQHEYDHIEGVLFVDHVSAFKRQLLKGKLANISRGKVNVHYRMKFPKRK